MAGLAQPPGFMGTALRYWALAGLFLAAGLILRLDSLHERAAWYDEVYSLWMASQPAVQILRESATSDPHPPLYYLLLHGWAELVGTTLQAARALSLFLWLVAMLLLWRATSAWFGREAAVGATALLSVHVFQVIASTEARMYGALQLAALLSTWLLWKALEDPERIRRWAAYGVSAAVMAYLSYYSVFLLLAHAFFVVAYLRGRVWGPALAAPAAFALAYLPWLPFLAGSLASNTVPWRPPPDFGYVATLVMTQVYGGHFLGTAGYYGGKVPEAWEALLGLLPLAAVFAGLFALGKNRPQAVHLVAWCWLAPLGAAVAASFVLGKVAAYSYHLTYLQPFAAVLAAGAVLPLWRAELSAGRRLLAFGAATVLLGYAAAGADAAWRDWRYQPFRPDLVARYLMRLSREGDTVVYMPQGVRRAVELYYVPRARAAEIRFDLAAWAGKGTRSGVPAVQEALESAKERVWVVVGYPLPRGAVEEVAKAARELGYVLGPVAELGGLRVGLLVRWSAR